eukprot:TRINITY_DN2567_c0_g1_i1.p1 TRINITY_DN2567_c0_g1~~TRINITY_DN2567_c0_g1_i1.p1  ORF type:complete len:379 (+),score=75.49 TRINITY_DN2567_c0_g1_i1:52-1188(+)
MKRQSENNEENEKKEKERERERESDHKERERSKEKKDKERSKEKEKSKERSKEKSKERSKSREKSREKSSKRKSSKEKRKYKSRNSSSSSSYSYSSSSSSSYEDVQPRKRKSKAKAKSKPRRPTKDADDGKYSNIDLAKYHISIPSTALLPDLKSLYKNARANCFWKAVQVFREDKIRYCVGAVKKDKLILDGVCKVNREDRYTVNVRIYQEQDKVNDIWRGSCNCGTITKDKKVCAHQVALLMEAMDHLEVQNGKSKIPMKEELKKTFSIKDTFTKEQKEIFQKHEDKIENLGVQALKDMLKSNEQVTTGNKVFLIERVAECMTIGCIPRCPDCGSGRPQFKEGFYVCPGFMDDTSFRRCQWIGRKLERHEWTGSEV